MNSELYAQTICMWQYGFEERQKISAQASMIQMLIPRECLAKTFDGMRICHLAGQAGNNCLGQFLLFSF